MKLTRKTENFIAALFSLVLLLLLLYGLHGMIVSQGVGYFFALKTNQDRKLWELICDGVVFLILMLLLTVPALLRKDRSLMVWFRFLLLYPAFVPFISLAYLLHPAGEAWNTEFLTLRLWLQVLLPAVVSLTLLLTREKKKAARFSKPLFAGCLLLLLLLIPFPFLQPLCAFLISYALILLLHDSWEKIGQTHPELYNWNLLLYVLLFFRGLYQILILTAVY